MKGPRPRPPHLRALSKITIDENGCWVFGGGLNGDGYGKVGVGSMRDGTRRGDYVHRVVYEALVGPIPEGLHIDHLCRVPACCNPEHLEAVPCRTNLLRGQGISAKHAARSACGNGHPYPLNPRMYKGARVCLICQKERNRAGSIRRKQRRTRTKTGPSLALSVTKEN